MADEFYVPFAWEDLPSRKTPRSAANLNHQEQGIADADIRNPVSPARQFLDGKLSGLGLSFGSGGSIDVATRGFKHDEDNTARFDDLIDEVKLTGRRILLSDGIWPGQITALDMSIHFDKNRTGFVGHMKGKHALLVDHTLGAEASITDVRHVYLPLTDTGNPDDIYAELTLSRASMAANNPQRGDAFWVYSDNYALDAKKNIVDGSGNITTLGAADFNGEGKRTYTGDWVGVLGVGVDVTDIAGSGGVRQGSQVVGAQSGATAWVSSSVVSSTNQRVAILNKVVPGVGTGKGYFLAGETLNVDNVARGTVSTRGAFIITDAAIEQDISLNPTLAKGRTDLSVDLDGFASIAVDDDFKRADVDQFLGNASLRKAAVRANTIVGGTGTPWIPLTWKHGVEAAACYRWLNAGVRVEGGPAHAEDIEGGWSYAWENLGGTSRMDLVLHGYNVRHVYSTNTRPTTGPTREYQYVVTKGVAHDNTIHDGFAIACLDYAFDTHGGSFRDTFIGNTIDGGGAGGRSQGRAAGGFQLRGHGSIVKGNTIRNVVDGIREISTFFPAPFPMDVIIDDNTMTGISGTAYNLQAGSKGDETRGKTKIHIFDAKAWLAPNITVNNAPANPNPATFIRMDVGWLDLVRPQFYGLRSGSPGYFGVEGKAIQPDHVEISGGKVDYTDSTATVRGWQIQSIGPIPFFGYYDHDILGAPTSLIRVGAVGQAIMTSGGRDLDTTSTITFAQAYTAADQTGTSNDTNAATVKADVAPVVGTFTISAVRSSGAVLAASLPWTAITIPAGQVVSSTFAIANAGVADFVDATPNFTLPAGVYPMPARVSTSGNVTWALWNTTGAAVTFGGGSVIFRVRK